MSSLSQQLKAISEKNASLALDRKSRALVHGRSLLFDTKAAAAQDFEYIYQVAREGLDELVSLDSRFGAFYNTLFAETSVSFDRNVQTKEILRHVESNIAAFVNLAAPYFLLSPALKALEWLVRRYHVNIHNAELLLLAALPYHNQPVFTRFMVVVPKSVWPAIFAPLLGYKDTLTAPPSASILKCFHNDAALFRLYSQHVVECLRNQTVYKDQLVFYLANTAQVLASHTRDTGKLNDEYIPVILEAAVEFFRDRDFRAAGLAADVRLTIYSVVSVMCALVPLRAELVFGLTESIVASRAAFAAPLRRHTLIVLGQLWTFYNEDDVPADSPVFAAVPVAALLDDGGALLRALDSEQYNLDKFLYFFFAAKLNRGDADAVRVLPYIRADSPFLFAGIAHKLLRVLGTPMAAAVQQPVADVFVRLVKADRGRLLAILDSEHRSLADVEMALSRTLVDAEPAVAEAPSSAAAAAAPAPVDVDVAVAEAPSACTTFFAATDDFARLCGAMARHVRALAAEQQVGGVLAFAAATVSGADAQCSFFLRAALTPAVPAHLRAVAVQCAQELVRRESARDAALAFYLLVPVILLGMADGNKTVRGLFVALLADVTRHTAALAALGKKAPCTLFMEQQLYAGARSIVAPHDAHTMLQFVAGEHAAMADIRFDGARTAPFVFERLFAASGKSKKFGPLLVKTFVLNQWAQAQWPVALKARAWAVVAQRNAAPRGCDERHVFGEDLQRVAGDTGALAAEAAAAGLEFESVVASAAAMVGGGGCTPAETEWLLQAMAGGAALQRAANARLVALFGGLSAEAQLRVCGELVELVVRDSDADLAFDPVDTLQALGFSSAAMVALLGTVNIVTQMPEQGVAKRRRRSSSSTQKKMAQDEISAMAAQHLRRLAVVLDVLEARLRRDAALASPELLQAMFKILTDLDYLCSDGKMPVLYAQETLAACMLVAIVAMKQAPQQAKLDSSAVRADLIVNSIRLSQSPQVQNRLLLVVAELASWAPEIILHSVMPIFTFMGAHTVRQDDEFSSSALQQTIAKVVPAITASSDAASTEIEFLLASFVTAFQHIPRHRRVRLFVSLVQTVSCRRALHTVLFLLGQQYAHNAARHRTHECAALLDFVAALLKTFSAAECMHSVHGFFDLWDAVPSRALDKDSAAYKALSARSIYGAAVASLGTRELVSLKARLLEFANRTFADDAGAGALKMKIALVLADGAADKDAILASFNRATAFVLAQLEHWAADAAAADMVDQLYESLRRLLNLLPLSHYVASITGPLSAAHDAVAVKVAKNFANLAGQRIDAEVTPSTWDADVEHAVVDALLPVLIAGVEQYADTELVQAYLDTFAAVVHRLGAVAPTFAVAHAKLLAGSLKTVTGEHALLAAQPELVVSALNAVANVVNVLGVKCIGYFPKILPPALRIWEASVHDADADAASVVQGSVLMLLSCLVKRLPAFVTSSLVPMLKTILQSDHVDTAIRSGVLDLVVEHLDSAAVLHALCTMALTENVYALDSAAALGLYLHAMKHAVERSDKKAATAQSAVFMRWMLKSFEFRTDHGARFSDNTIHSIESSCHQCGLQYVMKLNDKNFRPLFASLVRWAVSGEGSAQNTPEAARLAAFFKFFNKLQDSLRGIVTSYFSYVLDATVAVLQRFAAGDLRDTNLRRLVLHALASSFKYDQDDYWSHQSRFGSVAEPLVAQLGNIEDSIGKHLVKAIGFFVANVSADEHNDKLVHALIRYVSNEHDNTPQTKIWTVRVLKTVFQKMGESWLSYLPTFIPYIAELLEDDDEAVEMEVRKDLVRVIENLLGEPLDRYLS